MCRRRRSARRRSSPSSSRIRRSSADAIETAAERGTEIGLRNRPSGRQRRRARTGAAPGSSGDPFLRRSKHMLHAGHEGNRQHLHLPGFRVARYWRRVWACQRRPTLRCRYRSLIEHVCDASIRLASIWVDYVPLAAENVREPPLRVRRRHALRLGADRPRIPALHVEGRGDPRGRDDGERPRDVRRETVPPIRRFQRGDGVRESQLYWFQRIG